MNMSWAAHSGQRKCIPKPAIPANKQCLAKLARNAPICACMRSADTSCAAELAGPPAAVHQGLAVVSLVQVHPPHVSVLAGCIHLQRVVACTGREAAGTGKHKPVPPRIMSRLQSWPAEAAAEAVAAARGAVNGGPPSPLEVGCLAELQYQARVKGFMQPRK